MGALLLKNDTYCEKPASLLLGSVGGMCSVEGVCSTDRVNVVEGVCSAECVRAVECLCSVESVRCLGCVCSG